MQTPFYQIILAVLALNILVLVPVIATLFADGPSANFAFGPDSPARGILTSIYIAIATISAVLIAMHLRGHDWALPMTVALFAVQITYKLTTVALVGVPNPVVVSNLAIAVIQAATLIAVFRSLAVRA